MHNKHVFDPKDIESKFSIEDGMAYMDSLFSEQSEETSQQIENLREIIESLPSMEADFVDLYYFRKLKQTDIANLFSVSQPTVCYRLLRATARIQFLLQMPQVDETALLNDLEILLPDPVDSQIMALMRETTCQSEVAKQLGVTQGLVRHRFFRAIKAMRLFVRAFREEEDLPSLKPEVDSPKSAHNEYQKRLNALETWKSTCGIDLTYFTEDMVERVTTYVTLYEFIAANLNIMRELQKEHKPPKQLPDDYST